MNRCPTCQRIFADDTLSYCLEDGTALLRSVDLDSERTLALDHSGVGREAPPTEILDPASAPTLPASHPLKTMEVQRGLNDERRLAAPVRKQRSTRSVVLLTVLVTTVLLGLSGLGAWMLLKDGKQADVGSNRASPTPSGSPFPSANSNTNGNTGGVVTSTPTPDGTPETTPSPPEFGYITGSMSYPSDAIPGVMVACAENVDTRDTACSPPRKNWEAGVKYSLKLPPGKYYVYGTLLPGDDSVGGMRGVKAYYTEFMKCGMGENCNSHKRIILQLESGENVSGISVGDWWANL